MDPFFCILRKSVAGFYCITDQIGKYCTQIKIINLDICRNLTITGKCNANDLPAPFKALQMGNVWRADRPQRGRYRQFMQCDIDILGEPSNLAEIELILATTTTLGKLGFKNFQIRINERRILKAMAAYSGFAEEDYDTVFIILDKMDKIGLDGVAEELEKEGYAKDSIEKYLDLFKGIESAENGIAYLADTLKEVLDEEVSKSSSPV